MPFSTSSGGNARVGSTGAGGYSPAYGGIPQLPAYQEDTTTSLGLDPWAQLNQVAPGLQGNLGQLTQNIGSMAAGQIPQADQNNLWQMMAERGAGRGFGSDAPNTNAALARVYGLTQLQMNQLAATQQNDLMKSIPLQQGQTTTNRASNATAQAIYNAAPNPQAAAQQALANAKAGMAGTGGRGGYTLNPAAPQSAMGAMGYGGISGADASGSYANQWLNSPQFQSAQNAGYNATDAERAWQAAHSTSYADWMGTAQPGSASVQSFYPGDTVSTPDSSTYNYGLGGYGDSSGYVDPISQINMDLGL